MPAIGAVAAVLAAGLTIAGLFLPVHSVTNSWGPGEGTFGYDVTWWGLTATSDGIDSPLAQSTTAVTGILPSVAAALLLVAAVFMYLAGRSLRPGVRTAGRSLVSAGVGMLAGVATFQLISSLLDMRTWNESPLDPGEGVDFMVDIGLYLPLGAVILGVVAIVLAHRTRPARREPMTPPMGIRRPPYPGPMTGQQPAVPGPGQSSGRFTPVAQPPAPFAAAGSTSDTPATPEDDAEITQTVHVDTAAPSDGPQPDGITATITPSATVADALPAAETPPASPATTIGQVQPTEETSTAETQPHATTPESGATTETVTAEPAQPVDTPAATTSTESPPSEPARPTDPAPAQPAEPGDTAASTPAEPPTPLADTPSEPTEPADTTSADPAPGAATATANTGAGEPPAGDDPATDTGASEPTPAAGPPSEPTAPGGQENQPAPERSPADDSPVSPERSTDAGESAPTAGDNPAATGHVQSTAAPEPTDPAPGQPKPLSPLSFPPAPPAPEIDGRS